MKKQILFIAVSTSAFLFSCTKEKLNTPASQTESEAVVSNSSSGAKAVNSLSVALEGWYQFDNNLKDKTGKLADAVSTIGVSTHGVIYTDDRKGNPNSAIKFTGDYGLNIFNVPATGADGSVAVWVRYDSVFAPGYINYFVKAAACNPELAQTSNWYSALITTPSTSSVSFGPVDTHWHLLVATYDGSTLKFYIDGNYVGNSQNAFVGGPYYQGFTTDFQIGYWSLFNTFWYGSMDDLRFYTRTLSAKDVLALYNL